MPVLKADNILRRGLVQPFIWDQTRYISASSFSVTSPSLCPGGSSRDHRGESHSLKSARASSRPGNNGEAYLSGSPHGHQRGESYSLTSGCTELVRSWRSSLSSCSFGFFVSLFSTELAIFVHDARLHFRSIFSFHFLDLRSSQDAPCVRANFWLFRT